MIYYLRARFDNRTVSELGDMERRYWEDYQDYREKLEKVRVTYRGKMAVFSQEEEKESQTRETLKGKLRDSVK